MTKQQLISNRSMSRFIYALVHNSLFVASGKERLGGLRCFFYVRPGRKYEVIKDERSQEVIVVFITTLGGEHVKTYCNEKYYSRQDQV